MPGQKRRYLNSPNPIQHIHEEAVADNDVLRSLVAEGADPMAVIVDVVTTGESDADIRQQHSFR